MAAWNLTVNAPPASLVDLYELTMAQVYFEREMFAPATFSLHVRQLPPGWGYFLAAGLPDALAFLESFAFMPDELAHLESTGLFRPRFLDYLERLQLTSHVRALPEGTVCFPEEPLLEVTAPIPEAQLVETVLVNQLHYPTVIASRAARCVSVAGGRPLMEFGLRRAPGADAGLKAARSAYLAGFDATSNVLAGRYYGIPIAGTMAHSFIQAFEDEGTAFRAYAEAFPSTATLLVDTYDTLAGTRIAAAVGQEMRASGEQLRGVRLDSGDLIGLSFEVREILDAAGLTDTIIVASGNVDERLIAEAVASNAPIASFGVGTKLGVSAGASYIDMVYKMVSHDGRPVLKWSKGKTTWPGPKQVWRVMNGERWVEDHITLADEAGPAGSTPLLIPVMEHGKRSFDEPLATARERAKREVSMLPAALRAVDVKGSPNPRFSPRLVELRASLVRSFGAR